MIVRSAARAAWIALVAIALLEGVAHAQRSPQGEARGQRYMPRFYLSGWGGGFTKFGGFAEGEDDAFFNLDDAFSYGGGLHMRLGQGLIVGVDGAYASTEYQRHNRSTGDPVADGDASVATGLLSVRFAASGGGPLGLYLTAGLGVFAYDIPDPALESWEKDFAPYAGVGLDYRFAPHFGLFAEYGQFWAYHEKSGGITRNTATHNLLRLGGRVGI
jgi:hypothetical protein